VHVLGARAQKIVPDDVSLLLLPTHPACLYKLRCVRALFKARLCALLRSLRHARTCASVNKNNKLHPIFIVKKNNIYYYIIIAKAKILKKKIVLHFSIINKSLLLSRKNNPTKISLSKNYYYINFRITQF